MGASGGGGRGVPETSGERALFVGADEIGDLIIVGDSGVGEAGVGAARRCCRAGCGRAWCTSVPGGCASVDLVAGGGSERGAGDSELGVSGVDGGSGGSRDGLSMGFGGRTALPSGSDGGNLVVIIDAESKAGVGVAEAGLAGSPVRKGVVPLASAGGASVEVIGGGPGNRWPDEDSGGGACLGGKTRGRGGRLGSLGKGGAG